MEVFLESFSSLCMGRLICNIWILLVPGALVVLRPVSSPVAQAHPTEVVLAVVALHVVAAAVLLDANIALGAVLGVGRDVVRRLRVVRALRQPPANSLAVCWCVITVSAFEAESGLASSAYAVLSDGFSRLDHNVAVGPGAEPQVGVAPNIVYEAEVLVSFPDGDILDLAQHEVLLDQDVARGSHAGQGGGDPDPYLSLAVHLPTLATEGVPAPLGGGELGGWEVGGAHWAVGLCRGRDGERPLGGGGGWGRNPW